MLIMPTALVVRIGTIRVVSKRVLCVVCVKRYAFFCSSLDFRLFVSVSLSHSFTHS